MNIFFKRLIISIFSVGCLFFHPNIMSAQTYYVSSLSGNDGNDGRSSATAWKTIDKVNRQLRGLTQGNQVLFERGGIYYGTITIPSNIHGTADHPIIFGAYGNGDLPVISGAKQITGWEQIGANLWRANVPDHPGNIDILLIDGKKYYPARFPNKGYRTVTDRYSGGLQDKTLKFPDGYWNGATMAYKLYDYYIIRDTVTKSYADGRINKKGRGETPNARCGYFFQNHINAIDTIGEWVYDKSGYTLTLSMNKNPNEQLIEYYDAAFGMEMDYSRASNKNLYIQVEDLCFQSFRKAALYAFGGRYIIFRRNVIRHSGDGILVASFEDCLILENMISDVEYNGIKLGNIINSRIHDNTIRRVALSLDGGQDGQDNCNGILLTEIKSLTPNDHCEITNNRIDSIGYNGIRFIYTQDLLIKNNVINYCLLSFTDGGGIYTWKTEQDDKYLDKNKPNKIIDNIVLNTIGNADGSPYDHYRIFDRRVGTQYGIYLDDDVANLIVEGNTVANSGRGIFFHGAQGNKVRNNVLYNNIVANITSEDTRKNFFSKNEIKHNYMYGQNTGRYPGASSPYLIYYMDCAVNDSRIASTNQVDSNYISAPFNTGAGKINGDLVNKNTLSARLNFDLHSNAEPVSFNVSGAKKPEDFAILIYNPTPKDSLFRLDYSYMSFEGVVHTDAILLQPFKSAILFRCGNSDGTLNATVDRTNTGSLWFMSIMILVIACFMIYSRRKT